MNQPKSNQTSLRAAPLYQQTLKYAASPIATHKTYRKCLQTTPRRILIWLVATAQNKRNKICLHVSQTSMKTGKEATLCFLTKRMALWRGCPTYTRVKEAWNLCQIVYQQLQSVQRLSFRETATILPFSARSCSTKWYSCKLRTYCVRLSRLANKSTWPNRTDRSFLRLLQTYLASLTHIMTLLELMSLP